MRKLLLILLLALGFAASSSLLLRHFRLAAEADPGWDICTSVLGTGCDATLQSPWAIVLGIPLAGWGMVYYAMLAALLVTGWLLRGHFHTEARAAGWFLALLAAAGSSGLLLLMATGQAAWCPMCVLTHGVNFSLPFLLAGFNPVDWKESARRVSAAVAWATGLRQQGAADSHWKALTLASVGLVGVVMYQWVLVETALSQRSAANESPESQVETLLKQALRHDIPVTADDPQKGQEDAVIQLVVFSDFNCPACRRFAGVLREMMDATQGRVRVVYKHYPLDPLCNEAISFEEHPTACHTARAAEAARQQGKFWEFHDKWFETNGDVDVYELVGDIGVDLQRFKSDMQCETTKDKVLEDIRLGKKLGLPGTPAVFVNGRHIRSGVTDFLTLLAAQASEPNERR